MLSRAAASVRHVKLSRVTAVVLLALLGLVLAAAVTYAASTIVSHPIGLAAEPTDIGESLGPPQATQPATTVQTTVTRTTTVQTPVPTQPTTTPPTQTTFPPATTPSTTAPSTTAPSSHDEDNGRPDSDD